MPTRAFTAGAVLISRTFWILKKVIEAKIIKLEQNYRSTQVILDAANAVIENNTGRKPKNLWTDNDNGVAITYFQAIDERDEARFVIENCKSCRASRI